MDPNQMQVGGNHYRYRQKTVQPWDVCHELNLDFFAGNFLKYMARARYKHDSPMQDYQKAEHYVRKMASLGRIPQCRGVQQVVNQLDLDHDERRIVVWVLTAGSESQLIEGADQIKELWRRFADDEAR